MKQTLLPYEGHERVESVSKLRTMTDPRGKKKKKAGVDSLSRCMLHKPKVANI